MLSKHNDEDLEMTRLSLTELREIEGFGNVNDEKGEAILDDALALARMILELVD